MKQQALKTRWFSLPSQTYYSYYKIATKATTIRWLFVKYILLKQKAVQIQKRQRLQFYWFVGLPKVEKPKDFFNLPF
jgi:hypothetical protein